MNESPNKTGPIKKGGSRRWWLPISINRRLVLDGLYFAQRVPLYPIEMSFDLSDVAELRQQAQRRISWAAIFIKAYAITAEQHRPLRQAYIRWPWPHIIEEAQSTAMVVVNRQYLNEDRICWGKLKTPELRPLAALQEDLDSYQSEPVETIFYRQVLFSKLPTPLRRLIYWWNLNLAGDRRAKRLGTFTMSTLAGQGVMNRMHQSFLTSSLTYGPLDENGHAVVTLLCDHRVIDGIVAARALADLEAALHGAIREELQSLAAARAAA
ncbi:MAG TPA: hypothetical protein VGI75_09045 [Pirellulales bacterium]